MILSYLYAWAYSIISIVTQDRWQALVLERLRPIISERLQNRRPVRILCIGICGAELAWATLQNSIELRVIDDSPPLVRRVRRRMLSAWQGPTEACTIQAYPALRIGMPAEHDHYDLICVSGYALRQLSEPAAAIALLRRRTTPCGSIAILDTLGRPTLLWYVRKAREREWFGMFHVASRLLLLLSRTAAVSRRELSPLGTALLRSLTNEPVESFGSLCRLSVWKSLACAVA